MTRPTRILFVGLVFVLLLLYASLNFSLTYRWLISPSGTIFGLGVIVAVVIVPLVFFVVAIWIFLGNPNDKPSLLIALALGMTIPEVPLLPLFGEPSWILLTMMLGRIVTSLSFPLYLHFFLVFPKTPHLIDRFPKSQMLLYLVHMPVVYITIKLTWLSAVAPEESYHYYTSQFGRSRYLICGLYLLGAIAALSINYARSSELLRGRIRILAAGGVIGFLPLIMRFVYISSSSQLTTWTIIFQWQTFAPFWCLLVIPLSLAYAIRRHNALPIKFIVRRGARYLLVYQGAVVLELIGVSAAVYFMLHYLFRYLRWYMPIAAGIAIGLASIIAARLVERFHQKVISPAIKKKFFRQTYAAERILFALAERLRSVVDLEDVAKLVAEKIHEALYVRNVTFFIQDEQAGHYRLAFHYEHSRYGLVGIVDNLSLVLDKDGPVIQSLLSGEPVPSKILINQLDSSETVNRELSRCDLDVLREVDSDLLIRMATKERLLGVLSLGPRLGEIPFSWRDKELLSTVAWETALSIENAQLVKLATEEAVLRRELVTAREVQLRLLPQDLPETSILEFWASSLPAHKVGGDYYDMFIFGNVYDLLVVDVSGKGVPAALLMAFIKAAIQSYAMSSNRTVIEIVTSLNKRLLDETASNMYATMFYAQLDEASCTLRYVNAGHCKPFIVRDATAAGVKLEPLDSTGSVVGLLEGLTWDQKEAELFSGDALIVYSDGVTDAENLAGLPFGEDKLREVMGRCVNLSAREIVLKIIRAVTEWAGTAAQSDDITVFVVRVK